METSEKMRAQVFSGYEKTNLPKQSGAALLEDALVDFHVPLRSPSTSDADRSEEDIQDNLTRPPPTILRRRASIGSTSIVHINVEDCKGFADHAPALQDAFENTGGGGERARTEKEDEEIHSPCAFAKASDRRKQRRSVTACIGKFSSMDGVQELDVIDGDENSSGFSVANMGRSRIMQRRRSSPAALEGLQLPNSLAPLAQEQKKIKISHMAIVLSSKPSPVRLVSTSTSSESTAASDTEPING
jgi:hypothetical protein